MRTPAIEMVDISRLKPDPLNPRQISPAAMADLQRSLRQFGLVQPVVARRSDGLVIGGIQRLKAAQTEGWMEAITGSKAEHLGGASDA
jgi:ParB-like chromosome segregation protein Spo0J